VLPTNASGPAADSANGPHETVQLGRQNCFEATLQVPKNQASALRPYQVAAAANVHRAYDSGADDVVFVLPTGAGKTVIFVHIVGNAVGLGRRVLILAHRSELVEQISAALTAAGIAHGFIATGRPETEDLVQVASVASLARPRRLKRWGGKFDFIVVDEAHHAIAGSWVKILASQPFARVLGVTATPLRLDGRGLREQFDLMVEGPSTAELIKDGWLAPFVVFEPTAPDMSTAKIRAGDFSIEDQRKAMNHVVIGGAVVEYQRICPDVPAVAFCVDIQHSMAVAERFRAAGINAAHVDGETPAAERRALIAALGNGSIDVICNCGLVSEASTSRRSARRSCCARRRVWHSTCSKSAARFALRPASIRR
jgi:DNA repair protein RadD